MCRNDQTGIGHSDYVAPYLEHARTVTLRDVFVARLRLVSTAGRVIPLRCKARDVMWTRLRQVWHSGLLVMAGSLLAFFSACSRPHELSIAVIPQTTATPISEGEHLGAHAAALSAHVRLYWNAPTSEDDTQGQILLIGKQMQQGYNGLILTPDSATALMAPVQRLVEKQVPVVVVGSRLAEPPSSNLCYLLNDEEAGSRMAAERIVAALHGRGTVALLGVNPNVSAIVERARGLASQRCRRGRLASSWLMCSRATSTRTMSARWRSGSSIRTGMLMLLSPCLPPPSMDYLPQWPNDTSIPVPSASSVSIATMTRNYCSTLRA